MSLLPLEGVVFGGPRIRGWQLDVWIGVFVGLLVCRVVAVEVICGGDQSLGHLGADG